MSDALPYVAMAGVAFLAGIAIAQIAMLATTVYLHRFLAHGGIELRPEVRAICRIVIWMTTALKPRQWARVHRFHHANEDTPEDPHSPLNFGGGRRGGWRVLWRNAPLYTRSTRDPRVAEKYRDLTADRYDTWIFDHGQLGLVVGVSVACTLLVGIGRWLIGGWSGVVVGVGAGLAASGLHASFYVLAGGAINGFGHSSTVKQPVGGYAKNLPLLAWLTVGEGWHRNHHSAVNSPRFGGTCQFDLGWVAICVLRRVRMARVTSRGEAGMARLSQLRPTLSANRG